MADKEHAADKRKDTRHVVSDLEILLRDTGERLGNVINLSLSGLLISKDSSMAVDSILAARIPLEHAKGDMSDFEAQVRVCWFRQNDISGVFGIGLEFLDNTEDQRATIQRMIDEFGYSVS